MFLVNKNDFKMDSISSTSSRDVIHKQSNTRKIHTPATKSIVMFCGRHCCGRHGQFCGRISIVRQFLILVLIPRRADQAELTWVRYGVVNQCIKFKCLRSASQNVLCIPSCTTNFSRRSSVDVPSVFLFLPFGTNFRRYHGVQHIGHI